MKAGWTAIVRVVGIWAFGLLASGIAGSIVGTAITHAYSDKDPFRAHSREYLRSAAFGFG